MEWDYPCLVLLLKFLKIVNSEIVLLLNSVAKKCILPHKNFLSTL